MVVTSREKMKMQTSLWAAGGRWPGPGHVSCAALDPLLLATVVLSKWRASDLIFPFFLILYENSFQSR